MTYSTICMTMTLASLIPELCWNLNYTARAEHFSSTLYLLFLFCFVFVYVCVFIYMSVFVCIYVCICSCVCTPVCVGGCKRSTLGIFLYHSSCYCLKQDLSLNMELMDRQDWLINKPQSPPVPAPTPTAGNTRVLPCLASHMGAADLNLGPMLVQQACSNSVISATHIIHQF